jgi:putative DNA primase/helicase
MPKEKFSSEDLSRWKREINPAPIISSRVKLSRDNSEWLGLCPFHKEKTPSFKVWKLDDGVWGFKCFGCPSGDPDNPSSGNVFQFVQRFDKVPFAKAVETVLFEAGVAGWADGTPQADPSMPEKVHRETVTFSISQYTPTEKALHESAAGQAWLAARGIDMDTARAFHLGFVQDATVTCGTSNPWAKLGWVLFPTLSLNGHTVISVKYRSIVGKKKKIEGKNVGGIYRAQDTATVLYNLQEIKAADDIWVVEGEPDTLVLAQAGCLTVGYPMAGYQPTEDECDALSTAKRRFLAGDSDAPGIKAMAQLKERVRGATYLIKWPNNRKDANDVLTNECGNDIEKFKDLLEELKERATQTASISIVRRACDIVPKQIRWLWQEKIPYGKITLFAGNPDNGKSLASTKVAAATSTGDPFGEENFGRKPADVLMLIGEDDAEDTAVPRLMAAGADLTRIHFLESVRPIASENREVRLDMDIAAIERKLEDIPGARLLIIDPISNYLGDVSMVAEQEVRSILIPLKRLAEKFNIAIVIVMHLNKKNDMDAISRVGGAMAFIGVARCSWLFARNVQEEKPEGEDITKPVIKKPDTFSMLRIKNNLVSSSRAGMAYSVLVRPIEIEGDHINTPYVVFGKTIEGNADDALNRGQRSSAASEPRKIGRPPDKLQGAMDWLETYLQDGEEHLATVLTSDAKEQAHVSPDTLERACKAIGGVRKFKRGMKNYWQRIPAGEHEENEGETPQQSMLIQVEGAE